MKNWNVAATLGLGLLTGCASHHGVYEPACIVFAGDRVTLADESFVWDRSTDAIKVDDEGNVVDSNPGYPVHGSYSVDGEVVRMRADSGRVMDPHYLRKIDGTYRLLTADQNENWELRGQYDNCVLTLGGEDAVASR